MPTSTRDRPALQQRELPVLITVDVCDGAYDPGDRKARFKHVMDALPAIRDVLNEIINAGRGGLMPVTWFVRSDSQVGEATGDAAGLVRGWSAFWQEVRDLSGEIGWHPHLYKRDEQGWSPIRDPKRLSDEAGRIWREITAAGWKPLSCRMGESVCSSELMVFLDSIGLRCDSTALPGRVRDDGVRWFDWQRTPILPYHPAKGDYRRPPESLGASDRIEGEEPLSILEIPFTVAGIRAPYDPRDPSTRPPRRYIDLAYDPERLRRGFAPQIRGSKYLVLVIHPLQTAGKYVPQGGLVIGGIDVLRANLRMVMDGIEQADRIPRLVTMSGFRNLWMGEDIGALETEDLAVDQVKGAKKRGSRERKKDGVRASSADAAKGARRGRGAKPKLTAASRSRKAAPRKRPG